MNIMLYTIIVFDDLAMYRVYALSIRQSHIPPLPSIFVSSCCRFGLRISAIKSEGVFPLLSGIVLSAPLTMRKRTILVDSTYSTDFTAKCSGVRPS
jgi:hypothetical protein